jgi:hypothetical protein
MAKVIVSLADRLEFGVISVEEMLGLALRGRTAFYDDVKAGLVEIEKHGRFTRIQGSKAKEYLARLADSKKATDAETRAQRRAPSPNISEPIT